MAATKAVSLHLLRQLYDTKLLSKLEMITFTYTKENGDVSQRKGWLISIDEISLRMDGPEGVRTYCCSGISKIRLASSVMARLHTDIQNRKTGRTTD